MNTLLKTFYVYFLIALITFAAYAKPTVSSNTTDENTQSVTNKIDSTDETSELDKAVADNQSEKTFKIPSLKDIAREIKEAQSGLSSKQYLYCLKLLNFDNELNIKSFYKRFREIDKSVFEAKRSNAASRYLKETKTLEFKKLHGKIKAEKGERFIIIYPEYIKVSKKKTAPKKNTDETIGISDILSKAEIAFDETARLILIDKFINWAGKVKGKIYIVTDKKLWNLIRPGTPKARPDQIVITKERYREFFVYINPNTFDSAPEAIAYSVAKLVLKEYSRAVSRKSESKLPLFFISGVAFNISGLDSVIFEDGPKQIKKWKNKEITVKSIRELRKRNGEIKQLPLSKNSLMSFEKIVAKFSFPKSSEESYYYARQSAALVKYLYDNGKLPFIIMTKMLAKGNSFKDAFEKGYVKLRDRLLGKNIASKKSKKKSKKSKKSKSDIKKEKEKQKEAKDTLSGYKELARQSEDVIFYPLTKEYLIGEIKEKKQSKRRRR